MPNANSSTARSSDLTRLLDYVLLILLPLIPLWRCIVNGEVPGAFGQASRLGVQGVQGRATPLDFLQLDGVLQFYPWRDLVLRSWASGEVPYWNPYVLCGTPLIANSQSAGFYPFHILLGVLRVPTPVAVSILAWFHLALLLFGTYLLVKSWTGERIAALCSAFTLGLSAFMIAWIALPSVMTTFAWVPLGLYFWKRFTESRNGLWASGFGASAGLMLLGGHLQFAFYGGLVLVLGVLFTSFKALKSWKTWLAIGLSGAGALGLAYPQLSQVLAFSPNSHRANVPTEEGYQAYLSSALQPYSLTMLASPFALGTPHQASYQDSTPDQTGYLPALFRGAGTSANYAEEAASLGLLGWLGLFFLRRQNLRALLGFGSIALLGILLAFGSPLNRVFYFGVPGWSGSGSPGRAWIIALLGLSVLSGLGFSNLLSGKLPKKEVLLTFFIAIASAFLLVNYGPIPAAPNDSEAVLAVLADAKLSGILYLGFASIVLISTAMLMSRKSDYRWFATGPMLVVLSVISYHLDLVPSGTVQAKLQPSSDRFASLDRRARVTYPVRPPNWDAVLGIRRADGYDSLLHRDTVNLLRSANGGEDPAPLINGNMMSLWNSTPDSTRILGVSAVWTPENVQTLISNGGSRLTHTGGSARIVREGMNWVEIEATGAGKLLLYDRLMPGWKVFVNGQKTEFGDGPWRQVELIADQNKVRMEYQPERIPWGLCWLGALAALSATRLLSQRIAQKDLGV